MISIEWVDKIPLKAGGGGIFLSAMSQKGLCPMMYKNTHGKKSQ